MKKKKERFSTRQGQLCIWHCLETFLAVTARRALLASIVYRSEMLLDILQCPIPAHDERGLGPRSP